MLIKDGLVPLSVLWFASRVMTGAEATEPDPHPPAFLSAPAGGLSGRELA
jgi:hypothetical protein